MKKRVGILISGRGSNMMALVEAARAPDYPAEIAVVISNRPDAPGLERAHAAGHQGAGHRPQGLSPRARPSTTPCDAALHEAGVDLVCPAGLHAHPVRRLRAAAGWGASSTSTPRCCRPSRGCTRTSRRSTPACGSPAARCISSRRRWTAGPIVAQAAVPVLRRRHRRDAGRPDPRRPSTSSIRSALRAGRARARPRWKAAGCCCKASVNQQDCLFSPQP